jgi:predicted ArsR family transcriptional regulator
MAKFETAEAAAKLEKVRELIRKQNMTVTELAAELGVSKQLATHYLRRLSDLNEVKVVGTVPCGDRNPANVWGWIKKPKQAPIVNRSRRDAEILTRWIGGNPFERLTACGA